MTMKVKVISTEEEGKIVQMTFQTALQYLKHRCLKTQVLSISDCSSKNSNCLPSLLAGKDQYPKEGFNKPCILISRAKGKTFF